MAVKTPIMDEPSVKPRPVGTPYVDTRVSPNAFGAGLGSTMQAVGNELQQQADRARMEAAQFSSDDRDLKFARDAGAVVAAQRNNKLEAALDVKPAIDKIEEIRQQHEDSLQDPVAKRLFMSASRRRAENYSQMIEMHASGERDKFYAVTAQGKRDEGLANAANSISTIAAGPSSPGLTPEQAAAEKASLETEALDTTRVVLGKSITDAIAGEAPYYQYAGLPAGEQDRLTHKTIREGLVKAVDSAIGLASTSGAESAAAAKVGLGLLDSTIDVGGSKINVAQYLGPLAVTKRDALKKAHVEEGGRALGITAFQQTYDPESRQVRDNDARKLIASDPLAKASPIAFSEATKAYELEASKQQKINDSEKKTQAGAVAQLWDTTHDYKAVRGSSAWKAADPEWRSKFDAFMVDYLLKGGRAAESSPRDPQQWDALRRLHQMQTDSATSDQFLGQDGLNKLWAEFPPGVLHPKDFAAEERKLTDSLRMKADPPWLKSQVDMAKAEIFKVVGPQKKFDDQEQRAFDMTVLDIQNQLRLAAAKSNGVQTQEVVKLYEDLVNKYTKQYVVKKRWWWADETAVGAIAPPGVGPSPAPRRGAPPTDLGSAHAQAFPTKTIGGVTYEKFGPNPTDWRAK